MYKALTRAKRDRGFTLIELLVVIIIIGILAAIAIPVFLNQRKKGWDAQAKSDSRNLADMEEAYIVDHANYLDFDSTVGSTLDEFVGYRDSDGVVTRAKANTAFGYCIISKSRGGDYFVYDSQSGGLSITPYPSAPASSAFAAGTACAAGVPVMP
jgi:type IV pilus assembly protein PilA